MVSSARPAPRSTLAPTSSIDREIRRFDRRLAGWAWLVCLCLLVTETAALAQIPAPPPPQTPRQTKKWTETISGGLALTSGNRDTSTVNVGYEIIYDTLNKNLVKSDGLFLRGKQEGQLSAERVGVNGRDEYQIADGFFVFGQMQYLRDRFKQIDYLLAPTSGLGYRVVQKERTRMSIDAGLGGVWEKDFDRSLKTSGALTVAEKLTHALSPTASITQSIIGLHKTTDISDALYVFGGTLAASVTTRTQVKIEVIDTYKTKLLQPSTVHNDLTLVVAFVYKR
jgi:putative salt-induced outer membrane protein YdiY